MKRLLFIVLALFLANVTLAQGKGIKFETGTLAEALAKAKGNKTGAKLVFLDCYTSWCGPCKMMAKDIFPLEKVGKLFNAHFVSIKIDMEKGEGVEIAKKYNVRNFPTFLILDSDGNEINRMLGACDEETFIVRTKNALLPEQSPKLLKDKYEANKCMETGMPYLRLLNQKRVGDEMEALAADMYTRLSDKEKYDEEFFTILCSTIKTLPNPVLDDICKNKFKADAFLGVNVVTGKLQEIYFNVLRNSVYTYLRKQKKEIGDRDVAEAAKILGVLSTGKTDVAGHIGQIALLVFDNKYDETIAYVKRNLYRMPESMSKLDVERILVEIANNGTEEQKKEVKNYFTQLKASHTKQSESYTQRIESIQ